jgi:hypothetical protein
VADAVRRLVADRHSAEARGLFVVLARVAHLRTHDETAAAAALGELIAGGLAAFRGSTVAELVALVHATVDRSRPHDRTTDTDPSDELFGLLDAALRIVPSDRPRTRTALQLSAIRETLDRAVSWSEPQPTSSRV